MTLKIIDDRAKEYKIRSVPGNWKKAFKFLSSIDGQKKWEEHAGGFSKYLQTLLSIIESAIGIKKFLLIVLAIIIHLRERLHVLAWRMQYTAGAVAVHCRSGCSALRLRWIKLTQKSPVLFWIGENGDQTHI